MSNVTVRVRSIEDPVIQALLITDGTFVFGMDPKMKMALSVIGLILSICIFAWLTRLCINFQARERARDQKEKRIRYYHHNETQEDESS